MAGSAAQRGPGGFGWIACFFPRFFPRKATPAQRLWGLSDGRPWRGDHPRPAWLWGALPLPGLVLCPAARRGWRPLGGWRHLLRACHSDVAKSRQSFLRGCGQHAEMIIVLQGLEALAPFLGVEVSFLPGAGAEEHCRIFRR